MSYCDDCIHEKVCRFTKDVKEREREPSEYLRGYINGPTIRFTVECRYKVISQPSGSYFGEVPRS